MKKAITFLLSLCLAAICFSGCSITPKTDIWDGTAASDFHSGKGTKTDPYKIASAEELAYLAKSVNEGNTYAGESFSLECDIDLNNLEWTPIGTYDYQFGGNFDGNGHTVSNLKMSDVITYSAVNYALPDAEFTISIAGLFGFCTDASFCNLKLDGVDISVKDALPLEGIYTGTLAAQLNVYTDAAVTNLAKVFTYKTIPRKNFAGHQATRKMKG